MTACAPLSASLPLDPGSPGCLDLPEDDGVEERFDMLAAALTNVERRSQLLAERLAAAEAQRAEQEEMLEIAQEAICELQAQQAASRDREQLLQHEVARLSALLEAEKLQAAFAQERMAGALGEERRRRERAERTQRDTSLQRDEALAELQGAYSDIDAMQATLADSALYVRQLRRRLLELEVRSESAAASARAAAAAAVAARDQTEHAGAFSVASVRAAITAEVKDAARCEPEERRRRVRALQLRWHPDKNPAPLRDLATEVTKMINKALEEAEQQAGGGDGGGGGDAASTAGGTAGGGRHGGRHTAPSHRHHERD